MPTTIPNNLNDEKVIFKYYISIGTGCKRFFMFLIRREAPFLFWGMKGKWFEFCFTRCRLWYRPIIRAAIRDLFSGGKS